MTFATILLIGLMFGLIQSSGASAVLANQENMQTIYIGTWTPTSPVFSRDLSQSEKFYYYQIIEFNVLTSGIYTFASTSKVNTDGFIYNNVFNQSDPKLNLISSDDNSDGQGQFRISVFLQINQKYILVVTTATPKTIGKFLISSSGSSAIKIYSSNKPKVVPNLKQFANNMRAVTTFSGALSSTSQVFHRPYGYDDESYYFQAIQVTTSTPGTYTFTSSSSMDTYGYFYDTYFDPANPLVNLITSDDDGGSQTFQFSVQAYLQAQRTYVLVVTSHGDSERGSFSVSANGSGSANMVSITPTTSIPIITLSTAPLVSTTFSGALSQNSQTFFRPDGSTDVFYYFQAIQVVVPLAGSYVFTSDSVLDTMGYFYDTSFDPSVPSAHLITDDDDGAPMQLQFRIQVYLQPSRLYFLVVTTHGGNAVGSFTVRASGPAAAGLMVISPSTSRPIVTPSTTTSLATSYGGSLSKSSPVFSRPDGNNKYYYFEAIQVIPSTSDLYIFESNSNIDTMGYFYNAAFDPSVPVANLITDDDDSGDVSYQFRLEVYVQARTTYILVVTTHREYDEANFTVLARGPSTVSMSRFTPSTSRPIVPPLTTLATITSFSGRLSTTSQLFYRPDGESDKLYYFQAVQVTISRSANYIFQSESSMDTMGLLYSSPFDPSAPLTNLITDDDDSGDAFLQFRLQTFLVSGRTYIVVVTTHRESTIGDFRLISAGPASVGFMAITPTTSRPIITSTTVGPALAIFAGALSDNSPVFYRPDALSSDFFYFQALQVTVPVTGLYTLRSNSTIDTRGYLYQDSFDPSNGTLNLITSNDDGGGSLQFRIDATLQAGRSYILVVTTHREYVRGNYTIQVSGPGLVGLMPITPVTSLPITTRPTTPSILSSFAGILSSNSLVFYRPDGSTINYYYFQAIQVTVSATGTYIFRSNSAIDVMGYFYGNSFDPSNPSANLITRNDDGAGSLQFRIEVYLETGRTYVLVVTTHREYVMGNFTISGVGVALINFMSFIPVTSRPIITQSTTTLASSSFNGEITNAQSYSRPEGISGTQYFFQAIRVMTSLSGTYIFQSNASFDTIGYLYQSYFDLYNATGNLLTSNDDGAGSFQFRVQANLVAGRIYYLVVSTHSGSITGSFSVFATGPSSVSLTAFAVTTTQPTTTTTTEPTVESFYRNILLAIRSPTYNRPNSDKNNIYYYDAIQITVTTPTRYTIRSRSYFGAVGYLYQNSFDPLEPSKNLLLSSDGGGADGDFKIETTLSTDQKYIIVVSSYNSNTTGVFDVLVRGRYSVGLTSITPSGPVTETPSTKPPQRTTPKSTASIQTTTVTTMFLCLFIMLTLQMHLCRVF